MTTSDDRRRCQYRGCDKTATVTKTITVVSTAGLSGNHEVDDAAAVNAVSYREEPRCDKHKDS